MARRPPQIRAADIPYRVVVRLVHDETLFQVAGRITLIGDVSDALHTHTSLLCQSLDHVVSKAHDRRVLHQETDLETSQHMVELSRRFKVSRNLWPLDPRPIPDGAMDAGEIVAALQQHPDLLERVRELLRAAPVTI